MMSDNARQTLQTLAPLFFAAYALHQGGVAGFVFAGVAALFAGVVILVSN